MNKAEFVFEKIAAEKRKTFKDALTGAAAGSAATLATMPLEIIQIQQSTGPLKGKSFMNVAKRIYAKEGLRGFYTGTGTKLLKVAPTTAITFAAYELLKSQLNK